MKKHVHMTIVTYLLSGNSEQPWSLRLFSFALCRSCHSLTPVPLPDRLFAKQAGDKSTLNGHQSAATRNRWEQDAGDRDSSTGQQVIISYKNQGSVIFILGLQCYNKQAFTVQGADTAPEDCTTVSRGGIVSGFSRSLRLQVLVKLPSVVCGAGSALCRQHPPAFLLLIWETGGGGVDKWTQLQLWTELGGEKEAAADYISSCQGTSSCPPSFPSIQSCKCSSQKGKKSKSETCIHRRQKIGCCLFNKVSHIK